MRGNGTQGVVAISVSTMDQGVYISRTTKLKR